MDAEFSAKIFQNPIILERILASVLDENYTIPNQYLRLVSKSFDHGYLSVLKKRNREIRIESMRASVFVNYEKVEIRKLVSYFKFLNSVVKVNVKFVVFGTGGLDLALRKPVHDAILNGLIKENYNSIEKVVGLTELCNGCSDCLRMSETCQEYGPIYPSFFENSKIPKHFDNLIINEPQLDWISNNSENLVYLENHLPLISCRNLTIAVSETRKNFINGEFVKTPMPRELVEMMIQKWKVKSVKINCRSMIRNNNHVKNNNREFITPFRLSDPFANTEKSKINFKLDHVELNLTESSQCVMGITSNVFDYYKIYINVIANIRRIFPTDYIKITGVNIQSSTLRQLFPVLSRLRETIYIENQPNLRVDVELFTTYKKSQFDKFHSFFATPDFYWKGQEHICTVEDSPISRVLQLFDGNRFQQGENLGKRISYKGKINNCVMNFDVLA
uniref:F-box domain-containing protein n=1 Tax=Caenorhabditis tropicalis TaxID=1561998 RepID=A0A1I7V4F4_9PELO